MTVQEKIAAINVRKRDLIKYKYGRLKGVRFNKETHKTKWNYYQAF